MNLRLNQVWIYTIKYRQHKIFSLFLCMDFLFSPLLCMVIQAAMVDVLISKTTAWETERGVDFLYDSIRKFHVTFSGTSWSMFYRLLLKLAWNCSGFSRHICWSRFCRNDFFLCSNSTISWGKRKNKKGKDRESMYLWSFIPIDYC